MLAALLAGCSAAPVWAADASPASVAAPIAAPADYDVQDGHFFTQTNGGDVNGAGFSVTDEGAVPLWSEFRRLGGLDALGDPVSRRFQLGANVVQAFQKGVLEWQPDKLQAAVVAAKDALPNGAIPGDAAKPEDSRIAVGEAAVHPWSGWWWPSLGSGPGPHLFDHNGPLDKYDALVRATTGSDPRTQQWELAHFQFNDPRLDWSGKCNGWAVAALTEPEPTQPRTIGGVTFSVADQKGLLADYHFADPATFLVGRKDGGVTAAEFQKAMLDWVGQRRKGLVINAFDGSQQVASFAVYKYRAIYLPDPTEPAKTHVRMTVWAADYHVDPNFVGLKTWPDDNAKTYSYFIYGDRSNPSGGDWEADSVSGKFAHPQDLWYPDLRPETRNLFGALTSPDLDYGVIQSIVRGG